MTQNQKNQGSIDLANMLRLFAQEDRRCEEAEENQEGTMSDGACEEDTCDFNGSVSNEDIGEMMASIMTELLVKIKDILPVLKQYNEDLKVGQNNIIKEQAGMERMIHWFEMLYDKLFGKYKVLYEKVDSINNHIDSVIEEAPNKLSISVRVSDADYQFIQSMFDQQVQKMAKLYRSQMQEMTDLHDKQMKELNDRIDHETRLQYEYGNAHRREVDRMLKDSDGL